MNHPLVLQIDPTEQLSRHSEGAFITLKDGRIIYAWSRFDADSEDNGSSVIASRISHDGGLTWSAEDEILAVPENGAHNLMSVSFLRLRSGRILFLYASKTDLGNGRVQCTPTIRFSNDDGLTFSPPKAVTPSLDYHVFNNDRLIQLQDGTLVLPVAHHRLGLPFLPPPDNPNSRELKWGGLIFHFLSQDGGETWYESETEFYRGFPEGGGLQEPGVIELKDGRLWSWTRNAYQGPNGGMRQWQSFSDDGGRVWSEPEPSCFVSPSSPLSMKRIPSTGDLLAVWNDHSARFPLPPHRRERRPLTSAISSDEGLNWNHHHLLDDAPNHGFCYTAIHFTADAVLLAYCAGGPKPQGVLQRLRMRRIPITDLYGSSS